MIPEISKLNWSNEKPTLEEISGKRIFMEYKLHGENIQEAPDGIINEDNYDIWFDKHFIRYAIIDLSEEPLPYKGIVPKTYDDGDRWFIEVIEEGVYTNIVITVESYGDTEQEAIRNWNAFVRNQNDEVQCS